MTPNFCFVIADAVNGILNGSSVVALDCVLDEESFAPKSVRAHLLRLIFPAALFLVVAGGFVSYYYMYFQKRNPAQADGYLRSRVMISLLAVIFFSYQTITEDFMRTLNCVSLDTSRDEVPEYRSFAIARGRYWAEDMSEQCYEGAHGKLAFLLGVPGLLLFSIGIPLYLLVLLLWNKKHDRLMKREFLNTYGFVYQNYTKTHVYWEVVIMLRKALVGGVVVFAYVAGPNLQAVMVLGVLIVALVVHMIAVPFKYKILNILEGCSIAVSILTFYAAIVFNDNNTSSIAKNLLTVLLFITNTGLAMYLVFKIMGYLYQFVTARLKIRRGMHVPSLLVGRCWAFLRTVITNFTSGQSKGHRMGQAAAHSQCKQQAMQQQGSSQIIRERSIHGYQSLDSDTVECIDRL